MTKKEFIEKYKDWIIGKSIEQFRDDVEFLSDLPERSVDTNETITDEQFEKELERRWPTESIIDKSVVDENAVWLPDKDEVKFKKQNIKIGYATGFLTGVNWLKSELLKGGKG